MNHLIQPYRGVLQPAASPDGAKQNPGTAVATGRFPRISLSLHAGYSLRQNLPADESRATALESQTCSPDGAKRNPG